MRWTGKEQRSIPFGRIPLFLDLGKNTIRLVICTVRAFGHLAIAFDFLLPAHVACLIADECISLEIFEIVNA